jgi:hypothetical protein
MKQFPIIFSRCIILTVTYLISTAASSLPLIDYPQAREVYKSFAQADDYLLALGAFEKINSQWVSEREQRLSGSLHKQTFMLDDGHSAQEVFMYYSQQLQGMGSRVLFRCEGRSCGSSNTWANNHFHVKQLYGLDDKQFYSVYEVEESLGVRSFITLYGVTRGNKRSYMHIETLLTREQVHISTTPKVIEDLLAQGQGFFLPSFDKDTGQLNDKHLASLLTVFRHKRHWRLAVVAYDFSAGTSAQQQQRSLIVAQGLRNQLIAHGVQDKKIETYGLGSLVPNINNGKGLQWLSIVLLND